MGGLLQILQTLISLDVLVCSDPRILISSTLRGVHIAECFHLSLNKCHTLQMPQILSCGDATLIISLYMCICIYGPNGMILDYSLKSINTYNAVHKLDHVLLQQSRC